MATIRPLGINGLYPTENSPSSGYLYKSGDKTLLIDLGSGVFTALSSLMDPALLDGIILTHFHHDHCSDLGVLSYYLQTKGKRLKLYVPSPKDTHVSWISHCPYFDVTVVDDGQKLSINGLSADFYLMNHPVSAYGVRIDDGKSIFSYTGDTNLCDNLDKLLSGANVALMDSAFLLSDWSPQKPHLSAHHCGLLSKKHGAKLLLTHLNPTKDKSLYLEEARTFTDNVEVACYKDYLI